MKKELTGRHVLMIALAAFGTIIAANMTMLFAATGSFPGLVVKNAYVASQGWNARAEAQDALGWTPEISYGDQTIFVDLKAADGRPVEGVDLQLTVGRPTVDGEDRTLAMIPAGSSYRAQMQLGPGKWRLDLKTLSGPDYRTIAALYVPETR
ncbi:MAG: FixH family protein [Pseudomonadota bacterium]